MAQSIKTISSAVEFKDFIEAKPARTTVTVIHFWASWSESCKQMGEVLDELIKESDPSKIIFVQVDAESAPEVSLQYEIVAVPTFIFLKNGEKFDRLDGAYAAELTKKVRQYKTGHVPLIPARTLAAQGLQTNGSESETKEELNARLKKLMNSYKCMVFMKGSPEAPRCGFSKQLIKMLAEVNADYKTLDILEDEAVRSGLKELSNWPTFPQIYVQGELIGGLDILREMKESGELATILPTKKPLEERLKSLISKDPIMVFMKGSPGTPKCKFSRALMEILNDTGLNFGSFDILEDEDVRQGLKEYSKWPTYPQIYVKGQLIGGIDIIKELKESGELVSMLKP